MSVSFPKRWLGNLFHSLTILTKESFKGFILADFLRNLEWFSRSRIFWYFSCNCRESYSHLTGINILRKGSRRSISSNCSGVIAMATLLTYVWQLMEALYMPHQKVVLFSSVWLFFKSTSAVILASFLAEQHPVRLKDRVVATRVLSKYATIESIKLDMKHNPGRTVIMKTYKWSSNGIMSPNPTVVKVTKME